MNNKDTKELISIKLASRSIENRLNLLEIIFKLVCFGFLSSLAYYMFHNVDNTEALEAKFLKHMK